MRDQYNKFFDTNKSLWDLKTTVHKDSLFYDLEGFYKTGNSLNSIEEELLGDVKGLDIVHLQCHFGMDSISMARKGAAVTAIDFSTESIKVAKQLSKKMDTDVHFVECNVYDTLDHVNEKYDRVFISYGAICWLPELDPWAKVVSSLLRDTGQLILVEFHPVLYMFDFPENRLAYHYFNHSVYEEINEGSYAARGADIQHKEYFWNHPLSDVIQSLTDNGLLLRDFREYDYSPYDCFENMTKRKKNEYVYRGAGIYIPHIYSIVMSKGEHI